MNDEFYTGVVVARTLNRGSKSEYRAAFLETESQVLRLWRPAGPSFYDPVLMRLVGNTVRCRGRIEGGKLILSSWRKVQPKRA